MTADDHPMPLIFVVGTGRCGSTMVSRILREHPDVLSISELDIGALVSRPPAVFTAREDGQPAIIRPPIAGPELIDGPELWQVLSTPRPELDAFAASGVLSEMRYPRDGRFSPDTGIPPICHATLPMLSDDPDTLFDLLAAEVPTWPPRSRADQVRSLFGFLGQHLGKRVAVERSGGSIARVTTLHEQFPEARFVHIHRDGPASAVSMSRHVIFRRKALQRRMERIRRQRPDGDEGISEELRRLVVHPIDIERLMSFPIPLAAFGNMWSWMICKGLPMLGDLPPGRWTSMRYENVLAEPAAELTRLADFIGVTATPQWLTTATALISRPGPVNISAKLPPDALAALQNACAPGAEAIAAAESQLLETTGN